MSTVHCTLPVAMSESQHHKNEDITFLTGITFCEISHKTFCWCCVHKSRTKSSAKSGHRQLTITMTGKTITSGSRRYDDMIGFLVAFEKRAKTMEVCCDMKVEAITSNESSSSSDQPSYVRHADTIKRSRRGRVRDPVPKRIEGEGSNSCNENKPTVDDENFNCNNVAIINSPNNMSKDSDHEITFVSDDIEVTLNCNESECNAALGTSGVTDAKFKLPVNKLVKPENDFSSSCEHLEIIDVVSLSSSMALVAPPGLTIEKIEKEASQLREDLNGNANPRKYRESSNLKSSSILRERQYFSEDMLKEIFRGTSTHQKVAGVVFRDPVHEVIPFKGGTSTPSCNIYDIGDQVEIADGIHRRKIGRVVKTLGDVVQIEVGSLKPTYMYVSPGILQPLDGRQSSDFWHDSN